MQKKLENIKTKRYKKVLCVILWLIMIFILTRGIFSFLRKDESVAMKGIIEDKAKKQDNKMKGEFGTSSFAENFTRAFIEFNGDDAVYKDNLSKYVSAGFKSSTSTVRTAVLSVTAVKSDWIGENKVLVDCMVRFNTAESQPISPTPKASATKSPNVVISPSPSGTLGASNGVKEICLRVPVSIKSDGKYIVESNPTFTANDSKSNEHEVAHLEGEKIENNDIREITKTFLKSYCEDNATSIGYYMAENQKVKGLDNAFTFKDIDTFELRKNSDKYNVDVTYYVESTAGRYLQGMQIVFVFKDKRYLIEKLNTVIK